MYCRPEDVIPQCCKTKSRKWILVVFTYLLDTVWVNSATLYALNRNMDPKKQSSFEFGYSLVEQLILPQIRRNKNGFTCNMIRKIEIVTVEVNANVENPEPNKPGHCRICFDTIKGPSYKTLKYKTGKATGFCARCKSHCCNKHSVQYCKICS